MPKPPRNTIFALALALTPILVGLVGSACRATERTDEAAGHGRSESDAPLVALELDAERGRVFLALPEGRELGTYLYTTALVSGLGSNPVGLDRGLLGSDRWVRLVRMGRKLLVLEQNLAFRAEGADVAEARAVEESFADSVLWAGEIEERDGRPAVDLTSFVLRDAQGIARRLDEQGEGTWALDAERSAVDVERCLVFPENVVLEGLLTFAGEQPGPELRGTLPESESLTLRLRHSLVRPPESGYEPRPFDPRMGAFSVAHRDYSVGLDESIERRFAIRHRLRPGETLVYYVDRGAPEPVRSALLEGASWWADAFAAAGFPGGFRVELLPPDVHPLDVRYNVIQWVHRATRGWSYGRSITDPRTGEILKGHVSLGSLRVRQDRLIFEALLGTEETGTGSERDPIELALARIRQLSAHEVGHTLGLSHNFAASTYDGRASVMDYPAPWVRVGADGELITRDAYAVGVGSWDVQAIRNLYGARPVSEAIEAGIADGHLFLSDADARPAGAAHPRANLWDNGSDPVAELREVLAVRRIALERFGPRSLPPGAPKSELGRVLAPLYFYHRYQLDAVLKAIGGLDYRHALRDGVATARPLSADQQRASLAAVLDVLDPADLLLRDDLLAELHPPAPGLALTREDFETRAAPGFDWLGAATAAARQVFDGLLVEARALRLVGQAARDEAQPGLTEVLRATSERVFAEDPMASRAELELRRELQSAWVAALVRAAAEPAAPAALHSRLESELKRLRNLIRPTAGFHQEAMTGRIERFLERPHAAATPTPLPAEPPPGSPIGAAWAHGCGHGEAGRGGFVVQGIAEGE